MNSIIEKSVVKVPFFTQMVDLNNFRKDGFKTVEDAKHWHVRCCGIACIRMIVTHFNKSVVLPNYHDLVQQGRNMGAHCEIGWIHQGLVNLAGFYGVKGQTSRNKLSEDVLSSLKDGMLCIASVSSKFNSQKKGGHLIVVNGYKIKGNKLMGFYVKHPYYTEKYNFEERFITIDRFEKCFSGNYMHFYMEQ
jgi:hypothetical protein